MLAAIDREGNSVLRSVSDEMLWAGYAGKHASGNPLAKIQDDNALGRISAFTLGFGIRMLIC
jgi:hypothetical protein